MEEGRDGRGGPWSYREAIRSGCYSIGSSSSGTISTAYTSSRGSRLSARSLEAAMHFKVDPVDVMKAQHITSLVNEFFRINGGDMSVLERWFTELDVGWVPRVADGASPGELALDFAAARWTQALAEIMETIRLARYGSQSISLPICEEEPAAMESGKQDIPDEFQFARFTQQVMFKMLAFVDFMVAPDHITSHVLGSLRELAPYKKLEALILVGVALSKAIIELRFSSPSHPSAQVEKIEGEMATLMSAKEGKAGEAIWSTMEETRTRILKLTEDGDDSWGTQTSQPSPEIHKATVSLIRYIRLLNANYSIVAPIVSEAASLGKYVTRFDNSTIPLDRLITEMISCLEEKLAKNSLSFPDRSLRLLFLINNSYFIHQELHRLSMFIWGYQVEALSSKIEDYIQRYLQVSWSPVLFCLSCTTTFFLGRYHSPLPKFESEFLRTYTTQKFWKVPDPLMRIRLRKAIVERVAPGYRKYLEDNTVTTPRITPDELEEMLRQLFEG